jgi:hypothetical protein
MKHAKPHPTRALNHEAKKLRWRKENKNLEKKFGSLW